MSTQRSIDAYRQISKLYPKAFRDEYGEDLVATFAAQLGDTSAIRVWRSTIHDLVVTVPVEHLEVHMNRPNPHTVAVIASSVSVASLVVATTTGTGADTGIFLLVAVLALVVATLAWRAARPATTERSFAEHWRAMLIVGVALLAAVLTIVNVPPYNSRDMPGAGWALMMLSLVISIALITVGLTTGVARRTTRRVAADS